MSCGVENLQIIHFMTKHGWIVLCWRLHWDQFSAGVLGAHFEMFKNDQNSIIGHVTNLLDADKLSVHLTTNFL